MLSIRRSSPTLVPMTTTRIILAGILGGIAMFICGHQSRRAITPPNPKGGEEGTVARSLPMSPLGRSLPGRLTLFSPFSSSPFLLARRSLFWGALVLFFLELGRIATFLWLPHSRPSPSLSASSPRSPKKPKEKEKDEGDQGGRFILPSSFLATAKRPESPPQSDNRSDDNSRRSSRPSSTLPSAHTWTTVNVVMENPAARPAPSFSAC